MRIYNTLLKHASHPGLRLAGYLLAVANISLMPPALAVASAADISRLNVISTIPGDDESFDYASVDSAGRRLYVARGNGVMSIDLETLHVTRHLLPGRHVHSVVPLPGAKLLTTNGDSNTISISDSNSGKVLAEISVGSEPDAAVYDPATKSAFVADSKSGDLAVIDLTAQAVVARLAIGGVLESAVVDGNGRLYVNVADKPGIVVLDTGTHQVVARYSLPSCESPSGLGIDPETGVILSVCDNGKAIALRATDGSPIATVAIDRIADAVIFDRQHHMFFVPCARDATLVAIEESPQGVAVVGRIRTAIGAHTGALDPQTGRLYLPAADFTATPSGFKQTPGTFRVLVVGEK
jgi:YVTN family beta-propeller protein